MYLFCIDSDNQTCITDRDEEKTNLTSILESGDSCHEQLSHQAQGFSRDSEPQWRAFMKASLFVAVRLQLSSTKYRLTIFEI